MPIAPGQPLSTAPVGHASAHSSASTSQSGNSAQLFQQNCQRALDLITAPDLFKYQPSNIDSPGEVCRTAVENFSRSEAFKSFREQVTKALKNLNCFATDKNNMPFDHSRWGVFARNIGLVPGHQALDGLVPDLFHIYLDSCPRLQKIETLIGMIEELPSNAQYDFKQEITQHLQQLSEGLFVCGPGIISNVAQVEDRVMQKFLPVDLGTRFEKTRQNMFQQIMLEFIKVTFANDDDLDGNEIHIVSAFQNHFSQALKLPEIDDRYASARYVTDRTWEQIAHLKDVLPQRLSVDVVAKQMAEEALSIIAAHISPPPENCHDRDAFFAHQMDRALKLIEPQYGHINPVMVSRFNESIVAEAVTTDPTLLAIELMNRLPQNVSGNLIKAEYTLREGSPKNKTVLVTTPNLAWIKEGGTPRLPELTDAPLLIQLHGQYPVPRALDGLVRALYAELDKMPGPLGQQFQQSKDWVIEKQRMLFCLNLPQLNEPSNLSDLLKLPSWEQNTGEQLKALGQQLQTIIKPQDWVDLLLDCPEGLLSKEQIQGVIKAQRLAKDTGTPTISLSSSRHVGGPPLTWMEEKSAKQNLRKRVIELDNIPPTVFGEMLTRYDFADDEMESLQIELLRAHNSQHLKVAIGKEILYRRESSTDKLSAETLFATALDLKFYVYPTRETLEFLIARLDATDNYLFSALEKHPVELLIKSTAEDSDCISVLPALIQKCLKCGTPPGQPSAIVKALFLHVDWRSRGIQSKILQTGLHILGPHLEKQLGGKLSAEVWTLIFALEQSYSTRVSRRDVAEMFTPYGLDVHAPMPDNDKNTPLMNASRAGDCKLVDWLLSKGASVHALNGNLDSALHLAVEGKHSDVVEILLNHNAPQLHNRQGISPLDVALNKNSMIMTLDLLARQGDLNALDSEGYAPLHRAVREIASKPDDDKVRQRETLRIYCLLELGANPQQASTPENGGLTPIELAKKFNLRAVLSSLENPHKVKKEVTATRGLEKISLILRR